MRPEPEFRQTADRDNAHPGAAGGGAANGTDSQTQRRRLSDFLLAEGLITAEQLVTVIAESKRTNEKLPATIVRLGLLTEDQMVHAQSRHYRVPFVVLPARGIPAEILRLVPAAIARRHEVIPIGRSAGARWDSRMLPSGENT